MDTKFAQQILDHHSVGRVASVQTTPQAVLATTNQGQFAIINCGDHVFDARQTLTALVPVLQANAATMSLLLLPDYTGKLTVGSSLVHQQHRHYAVIKLKSS